MKPSSRHKARLVSSQNGPSLAANLALKLSSSTRRPARRWLSCRRFLSLIFWSTCVIFILYKLLFEVSQVRRSQQELVETTFSSSSEKFRERQQDFEEETSINNNEFLTLEFTSKISSNSRKQVTGSDIEQTSTGSDDQYMKSKEHPKISTTYSWLTKIHETSNLVNEPPTNKNSDKLSTEKSNKELWYKKQSKVFILIIQKEQFHSSVLHHHSNRNNNNNKFHPNDSSRQIKQDKEKHFLDKSSTNNVSSIVISPQIRSVIEILDAHRIEYTVDTTRSGLPVQLLADQDSDLEGKKFSVIILDDFIKYTQLSRWVRDQLDRHCRLNELGVIGFINHDSTLHDYQFLKENSNKNMRRSIRNFISPKGRPTSDKIQVSTDERESLTSQFPLIVKPIQQQKDCSHSSSGTSCSRLVDYQLNERSPILRILRRRPNFILHGPLPENPNQSPLMSMTSNHITYEPLTWCKLAKIKTSSLSQNSADAYNMEIKNVHQMQPHLRSARKANTRERNHHDMKENLVETYLKLARTTTTTESVHITGSNIYQPYGQLNPSQHENNNNNNIKEENSEKQTKEQIHNHVNLTYDELAHDLNSTNFEHKAGLFPIHKSPLGRSSSGSEDVIKKSTHNYLEESHEEEPEHHEDFSHRHILSMFDHGLYDGIKRVLFGSGFDHWLNRILLLDSIEYLSHGRILTSLDRYIQIDIDDIFVGEMGKRLRPSDVNSMIETQQILANNIEGGFKFNLGFSGKYFKHGDEEENLGDQHLVASARNFTWFCHTWSHSKAHLFNDTRDIVEELQKNLNFAREYKLPLIGHKEISDLKLARLPPTYAIAPHHSGVYPVHLPLYEAWRKVLNVQVTSTEEYPHLKPASARRAFVHQNIKVLPRQTCGLYTHTIYRDKYPNGISKLESLINGGELFETILHNPVNIYMSHMTNYANDRLAQYTFTRLVEFVKENTNLQLKYAASSTWTIDDGDDSVSFGQLDVNNNNINNNNSNNNNRSLLLLHTRQLNTSNDVFSNKSPSSSSLASSRGKGGEEEEKELNQHHHELGPNRLADYYFSLFPQEQQPIWTNPCNDKRHLAIWSKEKHNYCLLAPTLLIVGPQKTGTTALYTFLKMNPLFKSTGEMSPLDYEEVQFFTNKHYNKGVDWYFSRFASSESHRHHSHDDDVINHSDNADSINTNTSNTTFTTTSDNYKSLSQYKERSNVNMDSGKNGGEEEEEKIAEQRRGNKGWGKEEVDEKEEEEEKEKEEERSLSASSSASTIFFDKSANYFDDAQAALRASTLLPQAFIVILLVNPADRAYSWYQHVKAHGDPIANSVTFEQLLQLNTNYIAGQSDIDHDDQAADDAIDQQQQQQISVNNVTKEEEGEEQKEKVKNVSVEEKTRALRALRNRCLHPGYYFQHLTKWLTYYESRKIIIIDGLWFKHNPASVMNRLQLLLDVDEPLDYEQLLVFSEEKGFYCQKITSSLQFTSSHNNNNNKQRLSSYHVKCLGQSKGRKYPPMSDEARLFLNQHYWSHNSQLSQLLTDIGQPLPTWMEDAMTFGKVRSSVIY